MPSRHFRFLLALLAALALPAAALAAPAMSATGERYRVVAYDTAQHPIPADDADRIDTLIFAFARVVDGQVTLNDAARARLAQRIALKSAHPQLKVIESDVLKVNFAEVAQSLGTPKLRVVGNLPYNISTPILFHLLGCVEVIEDQHFMLQKEVIDRMVARPSTSDYGRLSVMLQWRYAMENVLAVPPQSFNPPPRVDSAVVRMVPHAAPAAVDVALLSELVQVAFSQRRKLMRHTLGKWLQEKAFSGEFDVQRRAEEVPVAQYVDLALALAGEVTL